MRSMSHNFLMFLIGVVVVVSLWSCSDDSTTPTPKPHSENITSVVRADGSGDYPTIQVAIDSAVSGDVIGLEDGTYTGDGNRDVDFLGKAITVRSISGNPTQCIVDCQGTEQNKHKGFIFQNNEGLSSVLKGITIKNGW